MLGNAAVAIWCDVAPEIMDEFEDWHSHEHTPERMAIPGFLRGSRWVSVDGCNANFVLYELEDLAVLTAGPYLERLNNPTPWSRKMMSYHLNMVRSLCQVQSSFGAGIGEATLVVRFAPQAGTEENLERWLGAELLPALPVRKGLVAARLLRDAGPAQGALTMEQKIRGGDKSADRVLLVSGYSLDALERLAAGELNEAVLDSRGAAPGSIARIYRLAYTLSAREKIGL